MTLAAAPQTTYNKTFNISGYFTVIEEVTVTNQINSDQVFIEETRTQTGFSHLQ